MNTETAKLNGSLPPDRQHAVAAGIAQYHATAAERDELLQKVAQLHTDVAGYKVVIEAQTAQITSLESKAESAGMVRDQAIADRAKYEALFVVMQAQLRAFAVPAAPLVVEHHQPEP